MAIVKMKRLRVVGMQADRAELLVKLQRLGCVEIAQPEIDRNDTDLPTFNVPDSAALTQARTEHQAGMLALETLKGYSKDPSGLLAPRPVVSESALFEESMVTKAAEIITQINESKQEIGNLAGEQTALLAKKDGLSPWLSLDISLDTESTSGVTVQFGTVPKESDVSQIQGKLSVATDLAELTLAEAGKDYNYVMLTCYTPALEDAMTCLKAEGWSRTNFRGLTGSAKENIATIEARLSEIERTVKQKEETLMKLGEHRPIIRQYLDGVNQVISRESAQSRLLDTENAFYLEGWVEAEQWPSVESVLNEYSAGYEVDEPKEEEIPNVPVKLKNSKLTRSLSVVTEMYSLPAYNGIDPNPLMAPFFVFFYGMMMADMGYGLIMILATQHVLSKAKPTGGLRDFCELFRMLGYSTFVWGAVTGGFFSNFLEAFLKSINPESTFTWFWTPLFTPLDDTIDVLYASMAFGAVHVLTGMAISFNKKAKEGRIMDGIMDEGSWWVVFAGIGVGVVSGSYVLAYVGVAMLVLTQGRDKKGAGRVVGGVASLYDITGYFGDILSYARLMALMLAGSVIAKVFNDLGVITGNPITFLMISLAGNTLNFLLNVLGCFVHTLRLQCLEFFGKFYMDGGKAFKPLAMDTNFVEIQK